MDPQKFNTTVVTAVAFLVVVLVSVFHEIYETAKRDGKIIKLSDVFYALGTVAAVAGIGVLLAWKG